MTRDTQDTQVSLTVSGVSKKFCRSMRRILWYGLIDVLRGSVGVGSTGRRLRPGEFWALDSVDLSVNKGEILGLVGPNGSGKTTLLRVLAGILPPSLGEIRTVGRVGTLLTVGAGFHPHMTVKENAILNGAILGMSPREVESKLPYIIEFSGLSESIDTPAGALSTGMRVRLGFAVAMAVQPDILLIDEVLAVGDQQFRAKCIEEVKRLSKDCAVVFASHNMEMVRAVATKIAVLQKGTIAFQSAGVDDGLQYHRDMKV